ncbi:hypothetical protein ONZ51_g11515 [Trametes cubensis]|uniref:Uncharacterized protein n=1 Tax=Trametes cubensis TaxID=1111947 RepID=A0AAD7X7S6_9APHY|nr:hypothetical protein ONZ51_g11515 [Trametes cubensis]
MSSHTTTEHSIFVLNNSQPVKCLHGSKTGFARLNFDVLYYITAMLDLQTMQAWRATCTATEEAVVCLLNIRYNGALSKYLNNPSGFRSLLRITNSVLSGSFALHVLDGHRRPQWTPNDMDIYVPVSRARRVATYLVQVEGYQIVECRKSVYSIHLAGFSLVIQLSKGSSRINIVQSATLSALHPIPYFWSTHVMNHLTADSFCIAYPRFTLAGRALLNPIVLVDDRYPNDRTLGMLTKYQARGYDFRLHPYAWADDPSAECAGGEGCPRSSRTEGDKFCLVGSFNASPRQDAFRRGLPDNSRTVYWYRGGDACGGKCKYLSPGRQVPAVYTQRIRHPLPKSPGIIKGLRERSDYIWAMLTRLGEFYPPSKMRALDGLHLDSRRRSPYALSTLPLRKARWAFDSSDADAHLEVDGKPVEIQLIGVIDEVSFSKQPSSLSVFPLYANDAIKGKEFLAPTRPFDPEWDEDGEILPLNLIVDPKVNGISAYFPSERTPTIDVYDNTTLRFDESSPRIEPMILKSNDLILTKGSMHLQADPNRGKPSYYLLIHEIRLIHIAMDEEIRGSINIQ